MNHDHHHYGRKFACTQNFKLKQHIPTVGGWDDVTNITHQKVAITHCVVHLGRMLAKKTLPGHTAKVGCQYLRSPYRDTWPSLFPRPNSHPNKGPKNTVSWAMSLPLKQNNVTVQWPVRVRYLQNVSYLPMETECLLLTNRD